MNDFPEPGPRRRSTTSLAEVSVVPTDAPPGEMDKNGAWALGAHVARARRRAPTLAPAAAYVDPATGRGSATGGNIPGPVTYDVVKASNGEDPWGNLPELSKVPRVSRHHANAKTEDREERQFDKTALHFDQHGRLMSHADYLAHCERWDYAWRSIEMGDRILDVGCGTDAPFMRAINFVQSQAAKVLPRAGGCYVGVDLNKLKPTGIAWAQLIGELDVTSDEGYDVCLNAIPGNADAAPDDLRGYSLIVCFEVVEHMPPEDGKRMLQNIHDLLSSDGRALLSTPVYDGKGQARNHVHEWFIPELQEVIESVGLVVERRMGTFVSEPVVKRWMKQFRPDWYSLYMESREFHSSGYMSGLIAPMIPDLARNNIWKLRRGTS